MKVMTIDPVDHIGVLLVDDESIRGITLEGYDRNLQLWTLMNKEDPNVVVFEHFALRAKSAMQLVGNTFVTCEVIGVLKLYCQLHKQVKLVELQPGNKEYCGFSSKPSDPRYKEITMMEGQRISEHVRDTYRLYNFYRLFKS